MRANIFCLRVSLQPCASFPASCSPSLRSLGWSWTCGNIRLQLLSLCSLSPLPFCVLVLHSVWGGDKWLNNIVVVGKIRLLAKKWTHYITYLNYIWKVGIDWLLNHCWTLFQYLPTVVRLQFILRCRTWCRSAERSCCLNKSVSFVPLIALISVSSFDSTDLCVHLKVVIHLPPFLSAFPCL